LRNVWFCPYVKGPLTELLRFLTRWAKALRDQSADVVMTDRVGSHSDAFWREEFPLMVAWTFGCSSITKSLSLVPGIRPSRSVFSRDVRVFFVKRGV
jgi:hypothetical protein